MLTIGLCVMLTIGLSVMLSVMLLQQPGLGLSVMLLQQPGLGLLCYAVITFFFPLGQNGTKVQVLCYRLWITPAWFILPFL